MANFYYDGFTFKLGNAGIDGASSEGTTWGASFLRNNLTNIRQATDPDSAVTPSDSSAPPSSWTNTAGTSPNNGLDYSEGWHHGPTDGTRDDDYWLDLGEGILVDQDRDDSFTDESWLRVTELQRYSVEVDFADGTSTDWAAFVITAADNSQYLILRNMGEINGVQVPFPSSNPISSIELIDYQADFPNSNTPGHVEDMTQVLQTLNFGSTTTFPPISVTCFVEGTMIDTTRGTVPIESLEKDDLVRTLDHGYQAIRWIGRQEIEVNKDIAPIVFSGSVTPSGRDLRVSPCHRMLLSSGENQVLFGEDDVFVEAKFLVNGQTIQQDLSQKYVTYFHMLFDKHEVVFSEGMASESFCPGKYAMNGLGASQREELFSIFPELKSGYDVNLLPAQFEPEYLVLNSVEVQLVSPNQFHGG